MRHTIIYWPAVDERHVNVTIRPSKDKGHHLAYTITEGKNGIWSLMGVATCDQNIANLSN